MQKLIYYLFIAIIACSICCCQSREEKALATIREEMNKTLDDIKSYEPIETKIDSLKYDIYGDTVVIKHIFKMKLSDGVLDLMKDDYRKAKKLFDIWDDPRMYNYSSFAYNKRKKAYEELQIAKIGLEVLEKSRELDLDTLLILTKKHTGELYGWRVHHKFRCKTKGGSPSLCDNVYFMDKKCEKILWRLDEDDMTWNRYVWYIDDAYKEAKERNERVEVDTLIVD